MVTPSHNQDATIHPGELRAPKPSSFLEGLRRDRDRRYPISQAEKEIEQRAFRVCMGIASLLPGSEIPELFFARDAYRSAARSGDAPGMQVARVAALSSCLQVGLSMAGTPIGEICEEVAAFDSDTASAGGHAIGAARSSIRTYDESLDPSTMVARYLLKIPGVADLVDTFLSVGVSGIVSRTTDVCDLARARFNADFARRFGNHPG